MRKHVLARPFTALLALCTAFAAALVVVLLSPLAVSSASAAVSAAASTAAGDDVTTVTRPLSGCTTHSLPGNDDGSTDLVDIGFPLDLFGSAESQLFVNNNGNVTFDSALSTYTPAGLASITYPIFAPFFADVDTDGASTDPATPNDHGLVTFYGSGTNDGTATDHAVGQKYFCVNWVQVGYFGGHFDKLNSFQMLIWDRGPSTGLADTDSFSLEYNYGTVQWETGDASNGVNGFGGTSAAVGWTDGSGNAGTVQQLEGSLVNGAFLDESGGQPGADALVDHSLNTTTPGRYVWTFDNGVAPEGGTISGRVYGSGDTDPATNGLSGAQVAVCPVDPASGAIVGRCHNTISGRNGAYSVTSLPRGTYVATAYPESGSPGSSGHAQLTWADGAVQLPTVTGVDVAIRTPQPLPDGTEFSSTNGTYSDGGVTVPMFYWGDSYPFTTHLPPGVTPPLTGPATFTVTGSHEDGSAFTHDYPLTLDADDPTLYHGTLPAFYDDDPSVAVHGPITVTFTFPTASGPVTQSFSSYIDPSGTVVDQNGHLVSGATVTLLAADDPAGPFTAVPTGSAVMSVANRTNPQTTVADGAYGWDVLPGFYEVTAHKDGCTDVTSDVLTIPPAVTGLTLALTCAGGGGAPPPPSVGVVTAPTVTGTPKVDATLTAVPGAWVPTTSSVTYQWLDGGAPIAGATSSTYTPTVARLGHKISLLVTGSAPGYDSTGTIVGPVTVVVGDAPTATTPPALTGEPTVGSTLTAADGTWRPSGATLSRQWLVGGTAVPGATGPTYAPRASDLGKAVAVEVTARLAGHAVGTATSAPVTVVPRPSARTRGIPRIALHRHHGVLRIHVGGQGATPTGTVRVLVTGRTLALVRLRNGTARVHVPATHGRPLTVVYSGDRRYRRAVAALH